MTFTVTVQSAARRLASGVPIKQRSQAAGAFPMRKLPLLPYLPRGTGQIRFTFVDPQGNPQGPGSPDDGGNSGDRGNPGGGRNPGNGRNPWKKAPRELPMKRILAIVVALFVVVTLLKGLYVVNEQQNAVLTMFGKVVRTDTSGLYLKIPWIQQVHIVDITTHGTGIGYSIEGEGQNIQDAENGIMITSDFNLLNIDFYLEYKVSDPVAYLYHSDNPEEILKNVALSSIRSIVAEYTVDEAMTTAKGQIQSEVKNDMLRELQEHDVGLTVVNITVQDSEPPTEEIIQAFKSVETAKQGADTAKNNALTYRNERLPAAEADADKIIQSAIAKKEARIAEAEGQVARFEAMYEQYEKYPLITKKRMFYETIEEVLPELKVVITDGKTETLYPLQSFTAADTVLSEGAEETTPSVTTPARDAQSREEGTDE